MKITSRWDRYLGMTAAMTQVSVPMTTQFAGSKFQSFKMKIELEIWVV